MNQNAMFDILVAGNVNLETRVHAGGFPITYEKSRFTPHGVLDEPSGAGGNVSAALAALGHRVCLATLLGSDPVGALVRASLEATPIALDGVVQSMAHTMRTVVLSDSQGREAMCVDRKDIGDVQYPVERFRLLMERASLVYVAHTSWTVPLGRMAREAGKRVATDLQNLKSLDPYEARFAGLADIVFFSDERLSTGVADTIRRLWEDFDVETAVCGQGAAGATLGVRENRLIQTVPAVRLCPVVSTTGAGDAMAAGFLSGLMTGHGPLEALSRAQVFAGHHVGEVGSTRGFLDRDALDRHCRAGGPGSAPTVEVAG